MKVNQKNKTRIGISLLCAIILLTGCHITPNKNRTGRKRSIQSLLSYIPMHMEKIAAFLRYRKKSIKLREKNWEWK